MRFNTWCGGGRRWFVGWDTVDFVPEKHLIEAKYNQIASINWESCAEVLYRVAAKEALKRGW